MTPSIALACWERALAEELGLILVIAEGAAKKTIELALYSARKASGNPDLQSLMLVHPGHAPNEIWLVKKPTDMRDVT